MIHVDQTHKTIVNILAFDTCSGYCSVAIYTNQRLKNYLIEKKPNQQSSRLIPMIEEVLNVSLLKYHDINLIAVNVGPGSFTGIRVGLSVAKGLALSLKKPIMPVTTMEAILDSALGCICIIQDAGRNQLYVQKFNNSNSVDEISIMDASDIDEYASGYEIIGDLKNHKFINSNAQLVAKSAIHKLKNNVAINIGNSVDPLYIRNFNIIV